MKRIIWCFVIGMTCLAEMASEPAPSFAQSETSDFFSFERGMQGWRKKATDLELGSGFINWAITRGTEIAQDGSVSLKFVLDNNNDAGKIWIEKPFAVEPHQIYQVEVEYGFASQEFGDVGNFTVITGVLKESPETAKDLTPCYKDSTRNHAGRDEGFVWTTRKYAFTVRTDEKQTLYAVIGIWGTYETWRVYYLDSVRVTLTKKAENTEFFSFENELEGWAPKAAGVDAVNGSDEWSIAPSREIWEDGSGSLKFDLNNLDDRRAIWIERAFVVKRKKKYRVDVDYALGSDDCGDNPRFRLITGVLGKRPETGDDLAPAFQEDTTSCAWAWLHKHYSFMPEKTDVLYLVIGVEGTQSERRQYHFDSITVTITKR